MQAIQTITDGSQSAYVQVVSLDGAPYRLRLRWSSRVSRWVCSLYLVDGTAIFEGATVNNYIDMLAPATHEQRPPGKLMAVPTDGSLSDADLTGLGTRVQLYYIEESDIE